MKIDKIEKNIIIGLILLLIFAIIVNVKSNLKLQKNKHRGIFVRRYESFQLPENILKQAETFGAYKELYNSDKLTLAYSYFPRDRQSYKDKAFHKKLTSELEKENIDVNLVVYKDWIDDTADIKYKNREKLKEPSTCGLETDAEKEIDDFLTIAHHCIINVCLVDMKNNKYTIISPDVDFVINFLKNTKS